MDDAGCYERLLVDPAVRTLLGTFYGAMAWKTSTQPFIREVTPALIHTLSNPPAALVCTSYHTPKGMTTMATPHTYLLKGHLLGACSCDWGCPCSFEARPTQGWCEGSYVWHVEEGHYNGADMAQSTFGMFIKFPGAPHEGNGTGVVLGDAQMPAARRTVLETMLQEIPPFSIFHSLLSHFLGFRYLPFDLHFDGIRGRLTIPETVVWQLTPMKNPVTGEDEYATLLKPTGFTSKRQELCATETFRLTTEGLSYDHSGKYGEFSPFEYTSA